MGARDVFINCAFDQGFQPIFRAIVFSVLRSGFVARSALETDDGAENRLLKIQHIIAQSRYGIHDISRTDVDGTPPLPRFNMPLELGMFIGAKRYGAPEQRKKRALIFDIEQYRYQRFISDIAGHDIHAHGADPERAIIEVATWLRQQSRSTTIPGGTQIAQEFAQLQDLLPEILADRQLQEAEMTFGDYTSIVMAFIKVIA